MRLLLLSALTGCSLLTSGTDTAAGPGLLDDHDVDADGYLADVDCDDHDAQVHPDAPEVCGGGGVDENCNGLIDDADPDLASPFTFYRDADGDTFGDPATGVKGCEVTSGYAAITGDCDDTDPDVNPLAVEVCDDQDVDEDCNGLVNDEDPNVDPADQDLVYVDADFDGYGDPAYTALVCRVPKGYSIDATDCDDIHGGVNPGVDEVCDGVDNDCSGFVDDDPTDPATWYADDDGDGYGDAADVRLDCDQPDGFVADATDCNDLHYGVSPAAVEFCDGVDDNCDGSIDEAAVDAPSWYPDGDGDGYGDAAGALADCAQPAGYVDDATDCDDSLANVHPGATEACDSADLDEDCDGLADNADASVASSGKTRFYADADGDSYGDADTMVSTCDVPSGFVTNDDDCDDGAATVNPAGTEVCDAADTDEDCDGDADDDDAGVSAATLTTFYRDADSDGYGGAAVTRLACDKPSGFVASGTDCDDTTSTRSPGNTEVCDVANTDEDCDSLADDADSSTSPASMTTYYYDGDGDGYGATSALSACDASSTYTTDGGDCDDADASLSPGEAEICNDFIDNDCSGDNVGCEWSGVVASTSATAAIDGSKAFDYFGQHMTAGDADNDGHPDLLVNSGYELAGAAYNGAVYAYDHNTTTATVAGLDELVKGSSAVSVAADGDVSMGDIDGDGDDDLLVGTETSASLGGVALLKGPFTSTKAISSTAMTFTGTTSSDTWGTGMAVGGDVDGDGNLEVAFSTTTYDHVSGSTTTSNVGAVAWVESPSGSYSQTTVTSLVRGGSSSVGIGDVVRFIDVNGDGADELLVGAQSAGSSGEGAVYLISGSVPTGTATSAADVIYTSSYTHGYQFGRDLVAAGDLDGDGYEDWVAGGHGLSLSSKRGGAVVMPGGALSSASGDWYIDALARIGGPTTSTGTYFGSGVAVPGDVDGDGESDIVVTAPYYAYSASSTGCAYLFLGPFAGSMDTTDAVATITAPSSSANLGKDVVGLGDLDDDGYADFAVSGSSNTTSNAGKVWFFHGLGL